MTKVQLMYNDKIVLETEVDLSDREQVKNLYFENKEVFKKISVDNYTDYRKHIKYFKKDSTKIVLKYYVE